MSIFFYQKNPQNDNIKRKVILCVKIIITTLGSILLLSNLMLLIFFNTTLSDYKKYGIEKQNILLFAYPSFFKIKLNIIRCEVLLASGVLFKAKFASFYIPYKTTFSKTLSIRLSDLKTFRFSHNDIGDQEIQFEQVPKFTLNIGHKNEIDFKSDELILLSRSPQCIAKIFKNINLRYSFDQSGSSFVAQGVVESGPNREICNISSIHDVSKLKIDLNIKTSNKMTYENGKKADLSAKSSLNILPSFVQFEQYSPLYFKGTINLENGLIESTDVNLKSNDIMPYGNHFLNYLISNYPNEYENIKRIYLDIFSSQKNYKCVDFEYKNGNIQYEQCAQKD